MAAAPLRTTTFTLTRADALAYERAATRSTPLGVLMLLAWLGLWAGAAFLVPADWAGDRLGWTFPVLVSILVAIAFVLALLLQAARQSLAARRRLQRSTEMTVSEWPDRLEIVVAGTPRGLPLTQIRESILAGDHLFLISDADVLILPRRAFADDGVIDILAARIAGRPLPAPVDAGAAGA
jgi:hypothetical protein